MTPQPSSPSTPWKSLGRQVLRRLVTAGFVMVTATSGTHGLTELEQARDRGSLVMLTVNGAATYYYGPDGEAGFDYELASAFADWLGIGLEVIAKPSVADLLPALERGEGDCVAANLSRSPGRVDRVRFGPAYEEIKPMVVYRRGGHRPDDVEDLADGRLAIVGGTTYEDLLTRHANGTGLEWESLNEASIEDIFDAISNEEIDYTIIDSNILDLNRRFFPSIREAFAIGESQQLAWATRRGDDDSLAQRMREFFTVMAERGLLADLRQRYYSHVDDYEAVGTFHFMELMRERLPRFRDLFEEAAREQNLDWRLLAAVSYQESHWNPDAVSYTGVRGLMMLTRQTARQLGIDNRRDPAQSVAGGARYLRSLLDRIPDRIDYPDRLWLALAAYNIGFGHLEDARVITQRRGGDPDRWLDVREHLPLLTQERHFSRSRFGYARGYEAVRFVENIRTFYDILVWMDGRDHPLIARSEET